MSESTNAVYLRLRRIYCVKGAEFCRPDLQAGWEEIERLESCLAALQQNISAMTEIARAAGEDVLRHEQSIRALQAENERLAKEKQAALDIASGYYKRWQNAEDVIERARQIGEPKQECPVEGCLVCNDAGACITDAMAALSTKPAGESVTPAPARASVTLEQLREIEWQENDLSVNEPDSCAACKRYKDKGHAPDCWLAAAIRDAVVDGEARL